MREPAAAASARVRLTPGCLPCAAWALPLELSPGPSSCCAARLPLGCEAKDVTSASRGATPPSTCRVAGLFVAAMLPDACMAQQGGPGSIYRGSSKPFASCQMWQRCMHAMQCCHVGFVMRRVPASCCPRNMVNGKALVPHLWSDGRRAKIVLRHRLQQQLRRGSWARSCHVSARITVARAFDACPMPAHAAAAAVRRDPKFTNVTARCPGYMMHRLQGALLCRARQQWIQQETTRFPHMFQTEYLVFVQPAAYGLRSQALAKL